MTEQEAIARVKQHARRRIIAAIVVTLCLVGYAVTVQLGLTHWRRPTQNPLGTLVALPIWGAFLWFLAVRPMRAEHRRLSAIAHLVPGQVARIRAGFITAEVAEERPREWSLGRRAKRLALGDTVWLSPAEGDDAPIIAVCIPSRGSPFVASGMPGIYTSLR